MSLVRGIVGGGCHWFVATEARCHRLVVSEVTEVTNELLSYYYNKSLVRTPVSIESEVRDIGPWLLVIDVVFAVFLLVDGVLCCVALRCAVLCCVAFCCVVLCCVACLRS